MNCQYLIKQLFGVYEKQMGIAGDDTWGARTHDEFLLSNNENITYVYLLRENKENEKQIYSTFCANMAFGTVIL